MLIYLNGLLLGLSMIMSLGPQNVFLIKQGARRNHAILSAAICLVCDIILCVASVVGLNEVLQRHPSFQNWLIGFGVCFLLFYAFKAFRSALSSKKQSNPDSVPAHNRRQIILFALGFSLLNPHAIIDTMVIIGSGSSQFPENKLAFLLGVCSSSLVWFSSLTMTTHYFANVLTKTNVWRCIEISSGILMVYIGIKLGLSGIN